MLVACVRVCVWVDKCVCREEMRENNLNSAKWLLTLPTLSFCKDKTIKREQKNTEKCRQKTEKDLLIEHGRLLATALFVTLDN